MHRCGPGSISGAGIWQGSSRLSRISGFIQVLRLPPPHVTMKRAFENASASSQSFLCSHLTFTILSGIGQQTDDKFIKFVLFFPEYRFWYFVQIVSCGNDCMNYQNQFSLENEEKYF